MVQDLNRLSWNAHISHLRKINLPLDSTAKIISPRLLNSSQWGFIDPLDSPDGGNIGIKKHNIVYMVYALIFVFLSLITKPQGLAVIPYYFISLFFKAFDFFVNSL